MNTAVKIILFFFVGALLVLVVTHSAGFAAATTAVGGQVVNAGSLLTGAPSKSGGYSVPANG